MNRYKTLVEALQAHAGTEAGILFLYSASNEEYLSYADLLTEAGWCLSAYQQAGIQRGDEVVLQFASLRPFVIAYWACLLGGLVPIPLAYADNQMSSLKVLAIWDTLRRPWLATDCGKLRGRLHKYADQHGLHACYASLSSRILHPEQASCREIPPVYAEADGQDIAFIQYSSGSTGAPKGVVLSHTNLLANIYGIAGKYDLGNKDSFLSWLPLSHDFGMIAFHLAPIVLGADQTLIPTNAFVWSPSLWFSAAHKHRATILGSPNFGYCHFLKRFKAKTADDEAWNLSCVRVIMNGAEPISTTVVDQFNRELGQWGLRSTTTRPTYGLAEATLVITTCSAEDGFLSHRIDRTKLYPGAAVTFVGPDSEHALEVVDCGSPIQGPKVRITDENRQPLGEGFIGTIEVQGGTVTRGYYHNPDATREILTEDGWLSTQDLGFMHQGRVTFVGRTKEIIVIGGQNYFPYDIESFILNELGSDQLNKYVACGVPNADTGTEELAIFVHYKKRDEQFQRLSDQIKQLVLEGVGLPVKHVIPLRQIPKTTSGKIQRFQLAQAFLAGEFGEMDAEDRAESRREASQTSDKADASGAWLRIVQEEVGAMLHVKYPDVNAGFFELGLHSMQLLALQERLEKRFGIALSSTAAMDYPTIRAFADKLQELACEKTYASCEPVRVTTARQGGESGPIAVVGMACRFPGKANTPYEFWSVLNEGMDPVREVPPERWKGDALAQASLSTRMGGFLDNIDQFDPLFFGISSKEAESMDPQHRLLLELTWEALEDAGRNPRSLANSKTGVFVGISGSEYPQVGHDLGHSPGAYTYTGSMFNSAAGRISYTFGLQGPSMAIDTACSSSLVAVHQGLLQLRAGNCDLALAASVNLILRASSHYSFSLLQALSASGRCRSFDEAADGYIRSEGAAVLVLKRLEDALKDGDSIWGVIRGAAVNHDGRSAGFTVPNGTAQEQVIAEALANAGVSPGDIDYVEAHGSGTRIGDPQEVNALQEIFRERTRPLYIGSVKSNIGHLESAAGMASLMKVLLSMRYGRIPSNLHFRKGNPLIAWDKLPIRVVDRPVDWELRNGVRRAGISSFSISGTNAHIVVESAPDRAIGAAASTPNEPQLCILSARTEDSLRRYAQAVARYCRDTDASLEDIACQLSLGRAALARRLAVVAGDKLSLDKQLTTMLEQADPFGMVAPAERRPVVFMFSGQGSQFPNMARALYEQSSVFRDKLNELDAAFRPHLQASLLQIVYGPDYSAMQRPLYGQPLIFSIQVALASFWEAAGMKPDILMGHSIGEYAAAYWDGVVSLKDAVAMVTARAKIMDSTAANGRMLCLLANESVVRELIRPYADVSVAAVNSPENVTISGANGSLDQIVRHARASRIFVEELDVSHPFHSVLMREGASKLQRELSTVRFHAPGRKWISGVTGEFVPEGRVLDAAYWASHLVEPVQFAKGLKCAAEGGGRIFLEIGTKAVLSGLAAQNFDRSEDRSELLFLPSLREKRPVWSQIYETMGKLWESGCELDWSQLYGRKPVRVEGLPHTPYDRKKVWYAESAAGQTDSLQLKETAAALIESPEHIVTDTFVSPSPSSLDHPDPGPIRGKLREMIARISGVEKQDVTDSVNLFSIGLDSLMIVQLRKRIWNVYGVDISIQTFFNELHTVSAIAQYILKNRAVNSLPSATSSMNAPERQAEQAVAPAASSVIGSHDIQHIIQRQLSIMEEQLRIIRGAPSEGGTTVKLRPARIRTDPVPADPGAGTVRTLQKGEKGPRLSQEQQQFVQRFIARWNQRTEGSKAYTNRHLEGLADWIVTLNFDPSLKELAYPLVHERSQGSRFWDIDGNEYIDTAMGYGASFFGHQPDFIVEAIREQLDRGFALGPQSAVVGEVTELVRELTGVERVAYCNSGTEAVMTALRLARAVTRRDRIVRFTNSYHGTFDGILAAEDGESVRPMAPGTPQSMVADTEVLNYGTRESLERIREFGHELAAVLVEPVQSRNPALQPREYLHELRSICTEYGIALIFDEMLTGFRIHPGGAQAYFGVTADIAAYGKLVGGGMPIGIVAGKAQFLNAIDGGSWTFSDASGPAPETATFGGTFCKHPLTMAACRAVLRRLKHEGIQLTQAANERTRRLVERANAYFDQAEVPLQAAHFGSIYRFQPGISTNMAMLSMELNLFFRLMLEAGVYVWERRVCILSAAHTDEDVDRILDALKYGVETLRSGGFDFRKPGSGTPGGHPSPSRFELSSAERRVYILSSLKGGNEAYQIRTKFKVRGTLDYERLSEAFQRLAAWHEMLRSSFQVEASGIVHRIEETIVPDGMQADLRKEEERKQFELFWERPFELGTAPLWRWALVFDSADQQQLYLCAHHIIADGSSFPVILEDLAALYNRSTPPPASLSYRKFVEKEREYAASRQAMASREWWLTQLTPLPPALNLPVQELRPAVNDFSGGSRYFTIPAESLARIKKLAADRSSTAFMLLLSIWTVYLSRLAEQSDFCIGFPMNRRDAGPFERTIGMFAETLVLRVKPDPEMTFEAYLDTVKQSCLMAFEHSGYSLETLLSDLAVPRDMSRNPLFDVMFNYETAAQEAYELAGAHVEADDYGERYAQFDLFLDVYERNAELRCKLVYAVPLLSESQIVRIIDGFLHLLHTILDHPEATLRQYSLLPREEEAELLRLGRGPQVEPRNKTASRILTDAFRAYQDKPAVWFQGREETFAELEARAHRLAAHLHDCGLRPGATVGILLPRSPDLLAAMLAVMTSCCAWVPMDASFPAERLRYMLADSGAEFVISTEHLWQRLQAEGPVCCDPADAAGHPAEWHPGSESQGTDLAYIIYTSGSSGRPKGVQVEQQALASFLTGMAQTLEWPEGSRTACLTTASFDIFLLETLLIWTQGGCVVLAAEDEAATPESIAQLIQEGRVDCMQMTPTRLQLLCADRQASDEVLARLKRLVVGGEAFPHSLLSRLQGYKNLRIFNAYGPTETCIYSAVKDLTHASKVSIGLPIANTNVYVLDQNRQLVPQGIAGQLWIGGSGVARGYVGQPELTDAKFMKNPFADGRIYCTGDIARWAGGELECLGREDAQVKIRGHRIELHEIEEVLREHPSVTQAAVILHELNPGNPVLAAYYQIRDDEGDVPLQGIQIWLRSRLPKYMIPEFITELASIPQTRNGKVDRNSLPALHQSYQAVPALAEQQAALEELDHALLRSWKKILGDRPIGIHDSFFDVGGNSFSIVLLHMELDKQFPGAVSVTDLFAYPTISLLKEHLKSKLNIPAEVGGLLALPPEWFEAAGEEGQIEAALDEHLTNQLRELGAKHGLGVSDTLLALCALYLHKSTSSLLIPMWSLIDGEQAVLQALDFGAHSTIEDMFAAIGPAGTRPSDAVRLKSLPPSIHANGEVRVAFGYGRSFDWRRLLRYVDLFFSAEEKGTQVRLLAGHGKRLSAETVLRHLKQLVKLLRFVAHEAVHKVR